MKQDLQPASSPMSEEQNVYAGVYRMLVVGMIVSNVLFGIGLILALRRPQYFPLSASWVRAQYHPSIVWHGLLHGEPNSFFLIGTLLLILTPIARVIVSIYAFWVDRDHKYVVVTGAVFVVIVLTIILGLLGIR